MSGVAPVLVGVDGSAKCLDAVRWAAQDAVLRSERLTIVTALHPHTPTISDAVNLRPIDSKTGARLAEQSLETAVQTARDTVGDNLEIATLIERGAPAEVLIRLGETAAMLVVGSRGLGEFTGGLIGSVSTAVATHAQCPITVVKSTAGAPVPRSAPVVVGVDGTANSEPALLQAFREASLRGVELVAVHAQIDLDVTQAFGEGLAGTMSPQDLLDDLALAESLAGWQEEFPDVSITRRSVRDRPVRQLVREADVAQLIVMGSRGRGGFPSMLMGSTSQAVLHTVQTPVMIVPTPR